MSKAKDQCSEYPTTTKPGRSGLIPDTANKLLAWRPTLSVSNQTISEACR